MPNNTTASNKELLLAIVLPIVLVVVFPCLIVSCFCCCCIFVLTFIAVPALKMKKERYPSTVVAEDTRMMIKPDNEISPNSMEMTMGGRETPVLMPDASEINISTTNLNDKSMTELEK